MNKLNLSKSVVKFAASVVFGLSVASIPAMAEDLDHVKITIPFEFKAGGVTLPAGVYTVAEVNQAGLIYIRGDKDSAMMVTHPGHMSSEEAESALEFRKTTQGTVLTEVRLSGHPSNVLMGTER